MSTGVRSPAHVWGITRRWPVLKPAARQAFVLRRRIVWMLPGTRWAAQRSPQSLPHVVATHSSPLLRQLGDSQMWLQHNKVTNLRIASPRIDGLLLRPGETFSFCRAVGNATSRRGYVFGMTLDGGEVRPGVGGGLCQIANLLHWMALHTDLTVVQRSEHTVDPFPDAGAPSPGGLAAPSPGTTSTCSCATTPGRRTPSGCG